MAVCQVCQHDNPPGVEYCEDCGAAMTPSEQKTPVGATAGAAASAGGTPAAASAGGTPAPGASPSGSLPQAPTPDAAPPAADAGRTPQADPAAGDPPAAPVAPSAGSSASAGAPTDAATAPDAAPPATPRTAEMASAAAPAAPAAPASTGANPRLIMKRFGALTSDEVPLLGERLVVGRFDPETGPVDIDLSSSAGSEHISRQHAELYREGGQWLVRDLGSTNGVFVKGGAEASFGPRVTAPRALVDGDEIAFGNARFVFRTD